MSPPMDLNSGTVSGFCFCPPKACAQSSVKGLSAVGPQEKKGQAVGKMLLAAAWQR